MAPPCGQNKGPWSPTGCGRLPDLGLGVPFLVEVARLRAAQRREDFPDPRGGPVHHRRARRHGPDARARARRRAQCLAGGGVRNAPQHAAPVGGNFDDPEATFDAESRLPKNRAHSTIDALRGRMCRHVSASSDSADLPLRIRPSSLEKQEDHHPARPGPAPRAATSARERERRRKPGRPEPRLHCVLMIKLRQEAPRPPEFAWPDPM